MPDTSGVVDASPTRTVLHLQYIDTEGKPRTDSYDMPSDATDAELNAFKGAIGSATNANLWNIGVTRWFATGIGQKSDADDLTNDSVKDNLVLLMKNSTGDSFDIFIPANLETATMVPGTENPDPENPLLQDVVTAALAIWGGYAVASYRFTERRQKNRAIKA